MVNQADIVGLLTVGSAAAPKDDVLQIGDAGTKQLVEIKQDGEEKGLSAVFQSQNIDTLLPPELLDGQNIEKALSTRQMPPLPTSLGQNAQDRGYTQLDANDQSYPEEYVRSSCTKHIANLLRYPCRSFA